MLALRSRRTRRDVMPRWKLRMRLPEAAQWLRCLRNNRKRFQNRLGVQSEHGWTTQDRDVRPCRRRRRLLEPSYKPCCVEHDLWNGQCAPLITLLSIAPSSCRLS